MLSHLCCFFALESSIAPQLSSLPNSSQISRPEIEQITSPHLLWGKKERLQPPTPLLPLLPLTRAASQPLTTNGRDPTKQTYL